MADWLLPIVLWVPNVGIQIGARLSLQNRVNMGHDEQDGGAEYPGQSQPVSLGA